MVIEESRCPVCGELLFSRGRRNRVLWRGENKDTLDSRFVADLVLQILSYVSEKERQNIKRRQQQGIDCMPLIDGKKVSSKTGNPTGRPKAQYPENWNEVYGQWKSDAITAVKAMSVLGLKRGTFYNLVKAYESK